MLKMLFGAAAMASIIGASLAAGSASAQGYYDRGPRPPYGTGAYMGVGGGDADCSFTLAGAHAGVTLLGINLGGGARLSVPGGCSGDHGGQVAYSAPPPPPPQPYGYQPPGPPPGYGYQGAYQAGYGYQGGYAAPVAYPAPGYVYASQPCGCQPAVYQPY